MSHPISGDAGAGDGMDMAGEVTESVPILRPDYTSDRMRTLGEELNALYHRRDVEKTEEVESLISIARGKMRRGPRLHPGEFLVDGRYRLITRLGVDSGSVRWQAFDRHQGVPVHLRVLHDDWVIDDDKVDAFGARAKALAGWEHPGVANVLDAGMSDEGFVFLITEWFGADLLSVAVKEGRVDGTDALQIALEVAAALKASHDHKVIHGSVDPGSVILGDDGGAHLTNFDLTEGGGESSLYDAPESMQKGSKITTQGDVYSLGMTLMFALHKDDLPFWVLRDPARLIEGLEAPDTVRALLLKAAEWDLDKRWKNTEQMVRPILADRALVRAMAERALERGRLAVASGHFELLMELEPEDPVRLRAKLGDIYTRMERYDEARTNLLAALDAATQGPASSAEPAAAPLLELLLQLATATGDWSALADGLVELAGKRAGGVATLLLRTAATVYEQELDNSAAALKAWTGVSANHQDVATGRLSLESRRRLADRLGAWKDYVAACEALLPYLKLGERAEVQYAIGRTFLLHLDDEERGLAWLQRSEEEGHSLVDLADRLEDAWAARGAWDRVIDMMAQRAEAEPKRTEISRILLRAGLIATSVHQEELAIRVYRQLLEHVPDHTVALRHLARIHHRRRDQAEAEELFDKLLTSFKGKNPKEPEASERAADYTAWARILLRQGRGDEAEELLQEALRLNPNLIQGLRVAGPLYLDRGQAVLAGEMFDRLLVLYRAVDMSRAKTRACLGNADVAWMQGRLTEAMGWANRALDVERGEVAGWWGLARSAMSARGGHPGADRAPWLMAVPSRFTPHEALARLLAGILDPKKMIAWLSRTGMGRGLVEGGDSPMRLACAMVDVLSRYQLIDPDLFAKLTEAFGEWEGPINAVQTLWFAGELTVPIAETYRWSSARVHHDFDPSVEREILAPPPELTGVKNDELRKAAAWKDLLGGKKPAAPSTGPLAVRQPIEVPEEETAEVIVDGKSGPLMTLWANSTEAQGKVGKVSLTLRRAGAAVYLEAGKGLLMDEVLTTRARVRGGETIAAGNVAAVIRIGDIGADKKVPDPPPAPVISEAPEADEVAPLPLVADVAMPVLDEGGIEASGDSVDEVTVSTVDLKAALLADQESSQAKIRSDFELAEDSAESETVVAAPVASPDEQAAADDAAAEDEEVVMGSPGRLVARSDEGDASEPTEVSEGTDPDPTELAVTLPNPASEHAANIMARMTPPPPERRESPAPAADVPEPEEDDVEAFGEPDESEPEAEAPGIETLPPGEEPPRRSGYDPKAKKKSGQTIVPQAPEDGGDVADDDAAEPEAEVDASGTGRIEVMSGAARGTIQDIGALLKIGSGEDAGLLLTGDSRLADNHCEVAKDGDRYVLRDLGSDAGTVINGQKVKERDLEGGEVIMVGRTVLRFLA